ncbi:hypothetical protein ANCCEY_00320 [Ancylostoma ceylanicum]|uniref:PKD/REJ-like domain-containing protein n=1 Tax=Ancylostoma ceylanicum TaxID=53326 RepID=A0A0D6MBS4_9BILA|nr:hypothetical protein ANCCEY_00320 [Ancylostoma ceylanicum]
MSYITILYLFYLTSVSEDVESQASTTLSIWQCYAANNPCASNPPGGPLVRNDSTSVSAEDLPSQNVPISIDNLLSKILIPEPGVAYGLLVLEAGNSSYVEWKLSSSSSSLPVASRYESNPPLVQESFARDLPIYHFDAAAYGGTPTQVLVVAPGATLSYTHKDLSENTTVCYHAAFIVAALKWTAEVAQAFTQQFNPVVVSDCQNCFRLPLSSDFLRLCPPSRAGDSHDIPVNVTISSLKPVFWNVLSPSQVFEATLDISNPDAAVNSANCSLVSNHGKTYPLSMELPSQSVFKLTLTQAVEADDFSIICGCNLTGQRNIVEATYNQGLTGMNYSALVEIEHGSVALPCRNEPVTMDAKFKLSLPPILSSPSNDGAYCYIAKTEMFRIPIRLQITCTETTPQPISTTTPLPLSSNLSATISRDLLGIVVESDAPDAFPVGLVPCSQVISEHVALGKNAVCIGDGDHVAVRFGDGAKVAIADILTVLGERVRLAMPGIVTHPNFTISAPSAVMTCMDKVTMEVKQITGDGRRSLRYQWQVKNASTELTKILTDAIGRSVSFPSKLLNSQAVVVVTGCNFVNMCTTSDEIRLRPVTAAATLSLTLGGVSQSLVPSMAIRLRALPELTRCNASLTIVPNDAQYNWFVNGTFVTNDDSYRIPAYTYAPGDSVEVAIEVNYKDSATSQHLSASAQETLMYVAEKLVATVDAVSRSIASDAPVVIDASRSTNPNERDGSVTHDWSCMNMTSMRKCDLPTAIETNAQILRVPPRILNQGMRIQAYVTVQQSWLNTRWEVVRTPDTSFFELSSFLSDPNTTFTQAQMSQSNQAVVSLTIPPANPQFYALYQKQILRRHPNWTGLLPGMQYSIRLNAYSRDGSSFADVQIFVNAPPTPGVVEVVPPSGASALNTQIEFRMGDGWLDVDQPLEYRFGLKLLFVDNSTESYWFTRTGASSHRLYLPSAQQDPPACSKRTGYRALLEVCDHYSSCSTAESATFEVSPPPNLTVAIVDMVAAINSDVGNGNIFSALSNMYALDVQKCEEDLDVVTADKITTKLLMTLDENSDSNDYKEVLASASRLMNVVTPPVLEALVLVLEQYRTFLGLTSAPRSAREKRAAVATKPISNEQEANDMLNMYDLLLEKNQPIVEVYLLNIKDFLSTFCVQLDASSLRVMKAEGSGYTTIQAQSLVPGSKNFSVSSYTIAGEFAKVIMFSSEFRARFSSWHCGPSMVVCQNICLATSQIKMTALFKNDQLMNHLFGNTYDAINLLDPLSGASVILPPNVIQYSVYIPLTQYQPSNYYACLLFVGKVWDETKCLASSFAKRFDGVDHIECKCSSAGMLSVFTTAPPVPMDLPDHNEIRVTFHLSSGTVPTATQQAMFVSRLAAASRVDEKRFVNPSSVAGSANSSQIWLTLRPPFRLTQMTNGYAVQAIQRAVESESGFKAYDSVTVVMSNYSVVKRNLNGDGNARKVIITIYRSFQNVVGNDTTAVANRWSESIANMLRVSIYRFKNARIFLGIIFNLTITLPFEEETTQLSAEEIALMMMECSTYQEFDLESNQGEILPVQPITSNDIVELIVDRELSTLVLVLIIVISTVLAFSSLYVGGAVVVKVRTDRLVEEERRRMVRIEPAQPAPVPPPQYMHRSSTEKRRQSAPCLAQGGGPHRRSLCK